MALRYCRASRIWSFIAAVAGGVWVTSSAVAGVDARTPTIRDAIEMVRVQKKATADGRIGAFSPNGELFAFVTWQGNLAKNTNVYSLVIADLSAAAGNKKFRTIVQAEYIGAEHSGDQDDGPDASPFERIVFLDNRSVAYLGRPEGKPQQVYAVDIDSQQVRQLTSHPTAVREFVADPSGVRLFSAVASSAEEEQRSARLQEDGAFIWDEELFDPIPGFKALAALAYRQRSVRQYFTVMSGTAQLVYDSRQSRPANADRFLYQRARSRAVLPHHDDVLRSRATLTGDRDGGFALMYPYAGKPGSLRPPERGRLAMPYGLVDLRTGHIEQFIAAPHVPTGSAGGSGPPLWSQDGRSALVFSLPLAGTEPARAPTWLQIDVETRRHKSVGVPAGWRIMGWTSSGRGIVLQMDNRFALLRQDSSGEWGRLETIGRFEHLNWRWTPATNGSVIVGLTEGEQSPPELVLIDPAHRSARVLTDLNPRLRRLRHAAVEPFRWSNRYEDDASGFLIEPAGFDRSRRYPLIVLLDNSNMKRIEHPYLLDGFMQPNGHAIQMLAAAGLMVLYVREPSYDFMKDDECERMREHVESAVARLGELVAIDSSRVGLSGFSRAGYHTDCVLMHAHERFAAATRIDGGGMEYRPALRPYTDAELQRIRTPLLIESHGLPGLVGHTAMADRLEAFGRPAEVLYFHSARHATVRPQHRLRSLETHLDWWRFWLQSHEDSDPRKRAQYQHWRAMRAAWSAITPP